MGVERGNPFVASVGDVHAPRGGDGGGADVAELKELRRSG